VLAEALNARRDRTALETAQKAAELNPALVEAWRELGDAYLEGRQAVKAEEAYRKAIARDSTYGFGLAKLGQALWSRGGTLEALDAINAATERGGDPFFLSAVRGDILAEMSRHREAAEAYDHALRMEPDDHWVLHQAAIEHSRAGNDDRAAELFERRSTTTARAATRPSSTTAICCAGWGASATPSASTAAPSPPAPTTSSGARRCARPSAS
jgi:tetratricopeptide (TPR) repeat protein